MNEAGDGRHHFNIRIERKNGFTDRGASMPTSPDQWTGADIRTVLLVLGGLAGLPEPTTGERIPGDVGFVGQNGERVRLKVNGPKGTAVTEPLPLGLEALAEAGLPIPKPPNQAM